MNDKTRQTGAVRAYLIGVLFIAAAVFADQFTKYLAVTHLKDQDTFVLISGVFELHYLENSGAAFGMLENLQIIFIAGALILSVVILLLYWRIPADSRYIPLRICAVLLAAGAIGNMIDRIRFRYVVDFLYFKLIDFPIFNVADCYVVIACVLFAILILFFYNGEHDFDFLKRK